MNRWKNILTMAIMSTLFITTACSHQEKNNATKSIQQSTQQTQSGQDDTSPKTQTKQKKLSASRPTLPKQEKPTFSHTITELGIYQKDDKGSSVIVYFSDGKMPTKPVQYTVHRKEVSFDFSLKNIGAEKVKELLSQLHVTQGVQYEYTMKSCTQNTCNYSVQLKNIPNKFTLTLGDLGPITLKIETDYLQYKIENSSSAFIVKSRSDLGTIIFIPEEMKKVILSFSEPMRTTNSQLNSHGYGKWLDNTHFEVQFDNQRAFFQRQFYSMTGNYLPDNESIIRLEKFPQQEWVNADNGKLLPLSTWERYYERVIASPNQKNYLGLVQVGVPDGDAIGAYYAVVLERKGKKPTILLDHVYAHNNEHKLNMRWIDNQRFILATGQGLVQFKLGADSDSQINKSIIYNTQEHQDSIESIAYDSFAKKVYVLTSKFGGKETSTLVTTSLLTYDNQFTQPPKIYEHFSEKQLGKWYKSLWMPIHISPQGVYWTKVKNNQYVTVWDDRKGHTQTVKGTVFAQSDKGVYLIRPIYKANKITEYDEVWLWTIGKKPILIEKNLKIDENKPFISFGTQALILNSSSYNYQQYNLEKQQWTDISLHGEKLWIPDQTFTQFYRRLK